MASLLRPAFLVLSAGAVLVIALVVVARAVRLRLERRRARLSAEPRRRLLGYLADGGTEEDLAALLAMPGAAWRAVEPAATAMLAKVRGESREALVVLFERRGVGERALAALSARRSGAVRRARAAEVLGSLGRRDAVPALCARLADRDPEVRVVAVRALGRIGDSAATGPVLDTLARPDAVPVDIVAYALTQLDPGADAVLLSALEHPEPRVRATVLDTLRLRDTAGAEAAAITALLADPEPAVRRRAAALLGRVGGRNALDPLIESATDDPDPSAREASVRALGDLGGVAAVPVLRRLLDDPTYRVAHRAGTALVQLGPAGLSALQEATGTGAAYAREALAAAELAGSGSR